MAVLDDLKYIARFDTNDALGVVEHQFQQLLHRFTIKGEVKEVEKVVVAGMGGSALAAMFIDVWPGLKVPFVIVRDYTLPAWVDEKTLVIASSYSGNTEETLSCLVQAEKIGAQIAIISAGGKLQRAAELKDYPYAQLPEGYQPRMAPFYNFKALISILEKFKLSHGCIETLESTALKMAELTKEWAADVPTKDNQAKQIAEHLFGKTPVMYGAKLYPAAYKWKINFNENAKNTAWCNMYPEFNHNEFLGWTSHPIEKPFGVIDLVSSFDHPQVKKRFEISDKLLSGKRPKAMAIHAKGDTLLEELLWVVALGDMASVYLALLNGLNPTPVDLIEKLKAELS
jgi:glucose/mannose-6-phosphate isomerase